MKRKNVITFMLILSLVLININCQKFEVLTKTLYTELTISDITHNSANIESEILEVGEGLKSYGFCYGLNSGPSFSDSKTSNTSVNAKLGYYSEQISNLQPSTTYFVRAYAEEDEIRYGIEKSFTTGSGSMLVTTDLITNINYTTATCGGTVTSDGSSTVISRGVCWSTSENPVSTDSHTSDGNGPGAYNSSITGLNENTTYYVRAYATSSSETVYGAQQEFTTLTASGLLVSSNEITEIYFSSATGGGNVVSEGGSAVTARGVCWNTTQNPIATDSHTTDGTGTGMFTSNLTGLIPLTTYYVRAYATNSDNTAYGEERSFTTSAEFGGQTILVTGGTFIMGCGTGQNACESSESPTHDVTLDGFYISKYEITNQQYADFLNSYGSSTVLGGDYAGENMIAYTDVENSGEYDWGIHYNGSTWAPATGYENYPVIYVTWFGANEFCKYYGGRIPTEAEWEYAARGGTSYVDYYLYCGGDLIDDVAWYKSNSGDRTHEVGTKSANQLGIYDMSGNVWEWCADWFADDYYTTTAQTNPLGPTTGTNRVVRGGSWFVNAVNCRAALRNSTGPDFRNYLYGFRLARSAK